MSDRWNARTAVANIIGCRPEELSVRHHDTHGGARHAFYDLAGQDVGRLTVGGPVKPLDGTPDEYYEIVFEPKAGGMHRFERVRASGIDY